MAKAGLAAARTAAAVAARARTRDVMRKTITKIAAFCEQVKRS
jgi:hypothetical protein